MSQAQIALPSSQGNQFGNKVWRTLDERLSLHSLAYPVPEYANTIPYILGGTTLFGFIILFATGIVMTQYYHPHPSEAHDSVTYIITQVPFGDFIRSIHFWTANLVVVTALLHLLRIYWTGSYKKPREANWLVGVALLALTIGFVFTGTIIKWDQEASEALSHFKEIGELLGGFGVLFSAEFSRSIPLLTRLYTTHITILPFLFLGLVAVHLFLVKTLKISPKPTENARAGEGYSPDQKMGTFAGHIRSMIGFGLILLAAAAVLSYFFPAPLGLKAVPGEEVTKPPWMLLWLYPIENVLGVAGILYGGIVFFILLALVPFIDRSPWLVLSKRRGMVFGLIVTVAILIALLVLAIVSVPATHTTGG